MTINVVDAHAFLDKIKIQFNAAGRPEVYDDFLDIMKDFQSGTNNTATTVTKVIELFSGHPALIEGFNLFLPSNYRVKCRRQEGSTGGRNAREVLLELPGGVSMVGALGEDGSTFRWDAVTVEPFESSALRNRVTEHNGDSTPSASTATPPIGDVFQGMSIASTTGRTRLPRTSTLSLIKKIKTSCSADMYNQLMEVLFMWNDGANEKDVARGFARLLKERPLLLAECYMFMKTVSEPISTG